MDQNAFNQSNCRFFKMLYNEKEMNEEAYFWHANKNRSFLQVDH